MSAPQGSKAGAEGDVKLSSVPPTTYGKFQVGFNQEFELDRKCSVKLPDLCSYLTADDDASSFDDSFDDETWFSETVDMTDTNQPTILVEFEVRSVATDASPDNFPLFALPPVPRG